MISGRVAIFRDFFQRLVAGLERSGLPVGDGHAAHKANLQIKARL